VLHRVRGFGGRQVRLPGAVVILGFAAAIAPFTFLLLLPAVVEVGEHTTFGRMARELHDVVAHHVSVIGVLAAAGKRQLDRDPARASASLASIEDSSRQAVLEMHRMLGFLREEGDDAEVAPPPTVRRLEALTAQLGAATLSVDVRIEGEERPLPTSVDLAAYRVVQEALTNTVKHAEASRAEVGCGTGRRRSKWRSSTTARARRRCRRSGPATA